jgi:hypothetical protein
VERGEGREGEGESKRREGEGASERGGRREGKGKRDERRIGGNDVRHDFLA